MADNGRIPEQPNVPVTIKARGVEVQVWGVQVPQLEMLGMLGTSSSILLSAGSVFATAALGVVFEYIQASPDVKLLLGVIAALFGLAAVGCMTGIYWATRQRKSLLDEIKEANQT